MDWKVTIITYNVAMKICDEKIVENFLAGQIEESSNIVVIGLQEVAHAETIGGAIITWCQHIREWMNRNEKMVLLGKTYQMTNQVMVFVRKQIIAFIRKVDFRFAKNTMGGLTGHKGSIGVRIQLRSPFSLVFVDSHFVHDVLSYQKRIAQFHTNKTCCFPEDKSVRAVFWFGDLNFRVEEDTEVVMSKIRTGTFGELLDTREQLKRALVEKEAFSGFEEQPIKFAPTYRLHIGTPKHDSKRTPSWCDRILYKGDGIQGISYKSNEKSVASDHFPVIGKFMVKMPIAPKSHWDVVFEHLPTWFSSIPLIGRFQVDPIFSKEFGSMRDWIGVYPSSIDDCTSTTHWIYFATCFEQIIEDQKYSACEFVDLPVGNYRLGYFSAYLNCIVGLSKSFQVVEQPET
ncbi:unnamed protein product [Caenorhabditis angaria]|uniref:Inositol polyphosphate-related phosphatase domain-containing protein n=1 Tax=Caenorhabditis angaria TaxID=860376 RepID=A0A9P1IJL3_9PELO|nr:unnamed protein product [Caenorhabditis angaria]